LRFPKGTFILEGKIWAHEGQIYLVVNHKSNSETRIKLKGSYPKELFTQSGSNASIKLKIEESFFSIWGESEFIKLNRYLDPFEKPTVYNDEQKLPKEKK